MPLDNQAHSDLSFNQDDLRTEGEAPSRMAAADVAEGSPRPADGALSGGEFVAGPGNARATLKTSMDDDEEPPTAAELRAEFCRQRIQDIQAEIHGLESGEEIENGHKKWKHAAFKAAAALACVAALVAVDIFFFAGVGTAHAVTHGVAAGFSVADADFYNRAFGFVNWVLRLLPVSFAVGNALIKRDKEKGQWKTALLWGAVTSAVAFAMGAISWSASDLFDATNQTSAPSTIDQLMGSTSSSPAPAAPMPSDLAHQHDFGAAHGSGWMPLIRHYALKLVSLAYLPSLHNPLIGGLALLFTSKWAGRAAYEFYMAGKDVVEGNPTKARLKRLHKKLDHYHKELQKVNGEPIDSGIMGAIISRLKSSNPEQQAHMGDDTTSSGTEGVSYMSAPYSPKSMPRAANDSAPVLIAA